MQNTTKRISILVAALLPVVILGFMVMQPKSLLPESVTSVITSSKTPQTSVAVPVLSETVPATPSTPAVAPIPVPIAPPPAAGASVYADGAYSVTSAYRVPEANPQSIGVRLTLKSDVIIDVTLSEMATDGTSREYQDVFAAGYKTFVVGKKIADVQLSRVSGASLTSLGFNDALAAIKKSAAV